MERQCSSATTPACSDHDCELRVGTTDSGPRLPRGSDPSRISAVNHCHRPTAYPHLRGTRVRFTLFAVTAGLGPERVDRTHCRLSQSTLWASPMSQEPTSVPRISMTAVQWTADVRRSPLGLPCYAVHNNSDPHNPAALPIKPPTHREGAPLPTPVAAQSKRPLPPRPAGPSGEPTPALRVPRLSARSGLAARGDRGDR
jgi:hypothetical protein